MKPAIGPRAAMARLSRAPTEARAASPEHPTGPPRRVAARAGAFGRALELAIRREARPAGARGGPLAQAGRARDLQALRATQGLRQTDPAEYDSLAEARTWGPASCSAAALAAVLRGRGVPARVADVLEAMPGAVSPRLGLVRRSGLVEAAARFGMAARDDVTSLEGLRQAVDAGQPVLVDVTSSRFPEGHWLVATAVDGDDVRLADSSGYALTSLPVSEFLATWSGKGVRVAGPPLQRSAFAGQRGGLA